MWQPLLAATDDDIEPAKNILIVERQMDRALPVTGDREEGGLDFIGLLTIKRRIDGRMNRYVIIHGVKIVHDSIDITYLIKGANSISIF
jgi:hypothetical protein